MYVDKSIRQSMSRKDNSGILKKSKKYAIMTLLLYYERYKSKAMRFMRLMPLTHKSLHKLWPQEQTEKILYYKG